jgi:hypothetical protein
MAQVGEEPAQLGVDGRASMAAEEFVAETEHLSGRSAGGNHAVGAGVVGVVGVVGVAGVVGVVGPEGCGSD